jgi:hypothetical protein
LADHGLDDPIGVGPRPVDLVDEDQGRDVEALQGSKEQWRLRLDAFYGGDNQDRAVQDAEDAFDLCNEVRMARSVDQVDRKITDLKRRDGGTYRDAAFAFEIERVG